MSTADTSIGDLVSHLTGDADQWIAAMQKGVAATVTGAATITSALNGVNAGATKEFSKLFGESSGLGAFNVVAALHVVHAVEEIGEKLYEDNADIKAFNASLEHTKELAQQSREQISRIAAHHLQDIDILPQDQRANAAIKNLGQEQQQLKETQEQVKKLQAQYDYLNRSPGTGATIATLGLANAFEAARKGIQGLDIKKIKQDLDDATASLETHRKAVEGSQEQVRKLGTTLLQQSYAWLDETQNVDKSRLEIQNYMTAIVEEANAIDHTTALIIKNTNARADANVRLEKAQQLAYDNYGAAEDFTHSLQLQINEFKNLGIGATDSQKKLYEMMDKGIIGPGGTAQQEIQGLIEQIQQMGEISKAVQKDVQTVRQLGEQSLTPGENYAKKIHDINQTLNSGILGNGKQALERRNRLVKTADEELIEQVKRDHKELSTELSGLGGSVGLDPNSADFAAKLQGERFAAQQSQVFGDLLNQAKNTKTTDDPSKFSDKALESYFQSLETQERKTTTEQQTTNTHLSKLLDTLSNQPSVHLSAANF